MLLPNAFGPDGYLQCLLSIRSILCNRFLREDLSVLINHKGIIDDDTYPFVFIDHVRPN